MATTTVYGDFGWDSADEAIPDRFLAIGMSGMLRILVVFTSSAAPDCG